LVGSDGGIRRSDGGMLMLGWGAMGAIHVPARRESLKPVMHERREGSWRAKPSACRSVWDIFWLVYAVSELYMCMYM
jgi:hypothetical protein